MLREDRVERPASDILKRQIKIIAAEATILRLLVHKMKKKPPQKTLLTLLPTLQLDSIFHQTFLYLVNNHTFQSQFLTLDFCVVASKSQLEASPPPLAKCLLNFHLDF